MINISYTEFADDAGQILDGLGIFVILAGIVISTVHVLVLMGKRGNTAQKLYRVYRYSLARSILLGLEFLVAGDIIRTVAGDLSFRTVGVLAVIVLIRALLSVQFETEIEGRWPWKRTAAARSAKE